MKVKLNAKHCNHTDYEGEVEISKVYKALFIIMFVNVVAIYVVLGLICYMLARSGF